MSEVGIPRTPEHPLGTTHEKRLLTALKRQSRHIGGQWAVQVHLSTLHPGSRTEHALHAAEHTFRSLEERGRARFFWLRDFDFVLLFPASAGDAVRSALVKIRFLFAGDPAVQGASGGDALPAGFVTWYNLDSQFDTFTHMVQKRVAAQSTALTPVRRPDPAEAEAAPAPRPGAALTPALLAKVERALASADLASHVRRQSVAAVVGRSSPNPVFTEVFVSIDDLRESLLPHVDLAANPWLFQRLTQTLDRRVLAMLTRRDDTTLDQGFSVNLNVDTILSDAFLRFDDSLAPGSHGTVVLELGCEDVYADLSAFYFARDFVRQRGYRVCLDGVNWRLLPFVAPDRLGVDLVKLPWTPDLPRILASAEGRAARATIDGGLHNRLILSRCGTEDAIRFGQEIGIALFQGRYLDSLRQPPAY